MKDNQLVPAKATAARAVQLTSYKNLNELQKKSLATLLEPNEMKCIANQILYLRLAEMNKTDQYNSIVDLVSEIKLLTGAIVYSKESGLLQAQLEMIHRFLATGFSTLTKQEIVHAFYLNNQGHLDDVFRHYGKELNAEFMGDVLRAYMRYKKEIAKSKGAQLARILRPQVHIKQDVDYQAWKEIVQADYNHFKQHRTDPGMWHKRKYYTMRKYGLLPYRNVSGWIYFMKQAMVMGRGGLRIPSQANLKDYKITSVQQVRDLFTTSEGFHRCVDISRQLAYGHAFGAMTACGIHDIWNEIKTTP